MEEPPQTTNNGDFFETNKTKQIQDKSEMGKEKTKRKLTSRID
jgi:hypothetical protein